MRRATVLVVIVLSGCATRIQRNQTTPPLAFWPLEAELELRSARTETACTNEDNSSNRSTTPWAVGPGFLYEQIKQKIAGADDGAIITSSTVNYQNGEACIVLTGRPYRITRARTVAPGNAESAAKKTGAAGLVGPRLDENHVIE